MMITYRFEDLGHIKGLGQEGEEGIFKVLGHRDDDFLTELPGLEGLIDLGNRGLGGFAETGRRDFHFRRAPKAADKDDGSLTQQDEPPENNRGLPESLDLTPDDGSLPLPNEAPVARDDVAHTYEDVAFFAPALHMTIVDPGPYDFHTTIVDPGPMNAIGDDLPQPVSEVDPINEGVLRNDTNAEGTRVGLTVVDVNGDVAAVDTEITLDSGALLTMRWDGSYAYNPNGAFEHLNDGEQAIDSFTYTVSDGKGGTDTATGNITIDGVTDGSGLTAGPPPERHDRGVPGSTQRDAGDIVSLESVFSSGSNGGGVDSAALAAVIVESAPLVETPLATETIASLV